MACSAVFFCESSAKGKAEQEITPSTTVSDADVEYECDSFGLETDCDSDQTPCAAPPQLTAGPPPPPMEDEAPKQLQPGPPPPTSDEYDDASTTTGSSTPREPQGSCQDGDFSFEETFFVFDYDDTILPSTWINRQKLRLDGGSRPTPEQMRVLGQVAEIAGKTLKLARQHGTVVFITNAERGWIELSCRKFLPTLAPMLENIRLVSARSSYEGSSAPSPLDWKLCAFKDQLSRNFGGELLADPSKRKNIFSLGDGIHEREALFESTAGLSNYCAKSLKFIERPDISQIIKQHELITGAFENIVHRADHLDLRINCP